MPTYHPMRLFKTLLLLACFAAPHVSMAQDKKVLRVGVNERPVFSYRSTKTGFAGLDIELVKAIAQETGYELELVHYPWKRILYLLKLGRIDMTMSAADTEERRQYAHFSNEYFRLGHNMLFVLVEDLQKYSHIRSLRDLKSNKLKIAVQRGAAYSHEYDALSREAWFERNLHVLDSVDRKIESLLIGRVDAYIGSEIGSHDMLKKMQLTQRIVPLFYLMSDEEAQTHMMYSKKTVSTEQVAEIDAALARLKANGTYQKIVQPYSIQPRQY